MERRAPKPRPRSDGGSTSSASTTRSCRAIPERADTAVFCETYGYALDDSANTIVVAGKSNPPTYVACVVLATTRLDVNRVVRRRLGVSKASFGSADATTSSPGWPSAA